MNHRLKMFLRDNFHRSKVLSQIYKSAAEIKVKKLRRLNDEAYLRIRFEEDTGEIFDINNPISFNQKMQWLKLYDHNPQYTIMVDKYAVKQYVEKIIGNEHVIGIVGGPWINANDIDLDSLPEKFVLKCNHDCGSVFVCTDKSQFNIKEVRTKLNKALTQNYYYVGREWPYKDVKPCIFAEEYMVDESEKELKDYKFFCFHGEPKVIQVDYGRFTDHKRNLYSTDWQYLEYTTRYPTDPNYIIERPIKLDEMLLAAKKLSQGIPFVRIDMYSVGDQFYFGEMTFYHGGGLEVFQPEEWNYTLGSWIDLSAVQIKE